MSNWQIGDEFIYLRLGSSMYDVHTEGEVKLRWTHVDQGRRSSPMWTST